ncbi:MAG: XisI protein [Saprospiraceae bacterium]
MEKVKKYQQILVDYLEEYANFGQPIPGIEMQVIADRENNRFQLVTAGWMQGKKFVHIIELHLDIKNGKVRVWKNGLDVRIADELAERGIPKSDIVLAFHSPQDRALTGFAIA